MPIGDSKKVFKEKEKEDFLKDFAKKTIGYTGADLESFAREAALLALRENIESKIVKKEHFDEAINKVRPSVTKSTIEVYSKIEENFLKSAKSAIPQGNSYLG